MYPQQCTHGYRSRGIIMAMKQILTLINLGFIYRLLFQKKNYAYASRRYLHTALFFSTPVTSFIMSKST